ncbi:MAG: DUF6410 domain-containing protein, partial [Sphingomonadales bacterium]
TFYFVGELLLSKMNPWTGTIIFLGTPSVIFLMGWMPQPIAIAFGVYVYLSLMLIFYMRYGGCEVVALPSFILGKRYTMYCPYNAMDAVERGVTPEGKGSSMPIVSLLSMTITLFVGSYFIFIDSGGIGRAYGVTIDLDDRWALLLLFPFLHLGLRGIKAYIENGRILSRGVLKHGFGGLVLLAFILSFTLEGVSMHYFWLSAMSLGGLWVLFEVFRMATGGRKTGAAAARQGK